MKHYTDRELLEQELRSAEFSVEYHTGKVRLNKLLDSVDSKDYHEMNINKSKKAITKIKLILDTLPSGDKE